MRANRIVGVTERSTSKAINEGDAMGAKHLGIEKEKVGLWFWELG